jgi:hypothetical protein
MAAGTELACRAMTHLFEDERDKPDNAPRRNFVFMGYPWNPPLPQQDYNQVVAELQEDLPVRFWYFADEVTTAEMMRKIWRAILRADLAVFDVTGGNPNVAFELGLAVAQNRRCMTLLLRGGGNPLGSADLGYAERAEYDSAAKLKEVLTTLALTRSTAMRVPNQLSYELGDHPDAPSRETLEHGIRAVLLKVFKDKKISKGQTTTILGSAALSTAALNALRDLEVLQISGVKRGARWVFTDHWVHRDHEVYGEI